MSVGLTCTEPDRKNCPRLCIDFCNKAEENAESVRHMAQGIIKYADKHGLVVTIERRPLQPLAMGHGESVVDIRAKRIPS